MRSLTSSLLFTLSIFTIANPSLADTGVCFFDFPPHSGTPFMCEKGDTAYYRLYVEHSKFRSVMDLDLLGRDLSDEFVAVACDLDKKIVRGTNNYGQSGLNKYVICTFKPKVVRETSQ